MLASTTAVYDARRERCNWGRSGPSAWVQREISSQAVEPGAKGVALALPCLVGPSQVSQAVTSRELWASPEGSASTVTADHAHAANRARPDAFQIGLVRFLRPFLLTHEGARSREQSSLSRVHKVREAFAG